ncbi:MAG: tetratricopeptide repeat protein [Bacteroidales bacterium]|nr:tetratricopeptide repeat protein [Bacteroidales bacterium]MBN2818453.1 tetratricopeptide repeat protein [Bacteroidales bacterium]
MLRVILAILIFSFSISLSAQDNEISALLKQADRLVKEKKYDEALFHIESVLKAEPLNLSAWEKKVNVMIQADRSRDISNEIEELIKNHSQQPEYLFLRGTLNLVKDKYSKAISDFDLALYLQMPEKYLEKVYLNRGMAYFNTSDFEKAEEDFIAAIEINPLYPAVYHSYGMLKYEQGDYDEAIKHFLKALQFDSENPLIYYNLGMSYFKIDDSDNACYYFNRSCSLNYRNACKVYLLECAP